MSVIRTQLIDARGRQKQKEVAVAIGISPKHLSNLERGEKIPSLVTAWKIAEYYGKSLEELFPDILEKSRR
ncbi:MAG: helix-turn-helix transcriptional regulator [Lachnospiraceae bacterium]|nr:helix-turn-helix transcriptional regulator [Lachnospiraceae bacterium]